MEEKRFCDFISVLSYHSVTRTVDEINSNLNKLSDCIKCYQLTGLLTHWYKHFVLMNLLHLQIIGVNLIDLRI